MNIEEIKIDHTKDSFCVRIPLITEQELKIIDNNLNNVINEITKQVIKNKDLAIAQHIIQKQEEKIDQLEQENKRLTNTNKSYKGIIKKQNKIIDEMAKQLTTLALWDNQNERVVIVKTKQDIKQYFEKKVEEK